MLNHFKVLLVICFWGASFAFTKKALNQMTPEILILFRCGLGFFTMILFRRKFGWLKDLSANIWAKLIFISFLGVAGHKTLQAYAMGYTSANHAGWLIGAIPLIVVLVMSAFFGEKIGKLRMLGFILGFIGILIVVISKQTDLKGTLIPTGRGDILFITSCFTWAFYTILTKKWFSRFKMFDITSASMAIAFFMLAFFSLLTQDISQIKFINSDGWLAVLYLGIFCSGIAYLFWNDGVEKLGPSSVSSFLYLEPFPAIAAGFIMLGEKVSSFAFLGGVVILAGVYWVNGGRRGVNVLRKIYSWFEEG